MQMSKRVIKLEKHLSRRYERIADEECPKFLDKMGHDAVAQIVEMFHARQPQAGPLWEEFCKFVTRCTAKLNERTN